MPRWTEEARQKQREIIMKSKPWEKATGPKTEEGKKKASMNSCKHGLRTRKFDDLSYALWMQKRYRHALMKRIKLKEMIKNRGDIKDNEILRILQKVCAQRPLTDDKEKIQF